ncbi:DUF4838 domain-containing protein [Sphingobacteriaceae bacterium WQ 2009]|uniref:DUF4838 domain-containing protein n=1 Tax=Rhinopithecimicrobium faecis TaxID=2820698 RepID=A0A8T4HB55_9SPHI|nr:DUF4838 domain-containing protein [Sphingobacteriaceae bacterium WQ 2009]
MMTSCAKQENILFYKKGEVIPQIYIEGEQYVELANLFRQLFKQHTGQDLPISRQQPKGSYLRFQLALASDKQMSLDDYRIYLEDESLVISGGNSLALQTACQHFFDKLAPRDVRIAAAATSEIGGLIDEISLTHDYLLENRSHYVFQFREPFFPTNNDPAFRLAQHTHHLYDIWGLWGHNLHKFIEPTEAMYAQVGGQVEATQYDFSSPELEKALVLAISEQIKEDPGKNHFMILPNDNEIACLCDACVAAGNTEGNASPAVFKLLNSLAKRFEHQVFFTAGYRSTRQAPKFSMKANTGVFVSTMDFPKTVPVQGSKRREEITEVFKAWKEALPRIYLWDYAINFDNYYDAFPSLLVAQQNLKFYQSQGVKGVFIQGNEDGYSAFEDLKAVVYAKLLEDPNQDLMQIIRSYLSSRYPGIGDDIADYYLAIEQRALATPFNQDIYAGIKQAQRKYLQVSEFHSFYKKLEQHMESEAPADSQLQKLYLAMTFQQLEIMRGNGILEFGYAAQLSGQRFYEAYPQVSVYLERVQRLAQELKLPIYNELNDRIVDYIASWQDILLNNPYRNLIALRKFHAISQLDEDYTKLQMLTDGAMGFLDYQNNWFLNSKTDFMLTIDIDAEIQSSKSISLTFLQDSKRRLEAPLRVDVMLDGSLLTQTLIPQNGKTGKARIPVFIKLPKAFTGKRLMLSIKQKPKKITALDEIIFL